MDTGQARIGRTVADALSKVGHGILYLAWCPSEINLNRKFRYNVIYSQTKAGSDIFDQTVMKERPDIVLTIGDCWNFDYINMCKTRGLFYYMMYTAVDGIGYSGGVPKHFEDYIGGADYVVTYTEYGRRAVLKTMPYFENRIAMIYHGIDDKVYHRLPDEVVKEKVNRFNPQKKFMFLYSGRTHFRKNFIHIIKAYRIYIDRTGDNESGLWLNVNFKDSVGHDVNKLILEYGLKGRIHAFDYAVNNKSAIRLMPEEEYVALLNMCNCVVSVGGEGFGYLIAEAFMAKTHVITLGDSATGELGAAGRARLIKPEGHLAVTGMELTERPFPNPKEIAKAMIEARKGKNKEYIDKAYKWAMENLSQSKVDRDWKRLLNKIEHPLDYPVVMEVPK
ncbi:MAG: hypothetical protein HOG49_40695 [Candidatus Scalindua sp.]|nr:hypothetical protein [Candidatus Scalindua sp.]